MLYAKKKKMYEKLTITLTLNFRLRCLVCIYNIYICILYTELLTLLVLPLFFFYSNISFISPQNEQIFVSILESFDVHFR